MRRIGGDTDHDGRAAELKARGVTVGRFQVRSVMKAEKLEAIRPKRFVPKTTTSNNRLASPNLLKNEENEPTTPKAVIIGDITRFAARLGEVELSGNISG